MLATRGPSPSPFAGASIWQRLSPCLCQSAAVQAQIAASIRSSRCLYSRSLLGEGSSRSCLVTEWEARSSGGSRRLSVSRRWMSWSHVFARSRRKSAIRCFGRLRLYLVLNSGAGDCGAPGCSSVGSGGILLAASGMLLRPSQGSACVCWFNNVARRRLRVCVLRPAR